MCGIKCVVFNLQNWGFGTMDTSADIVFQDIAKFTPPTSVAFKKGSAEPVENRVEVFRTERSTLALQHFEIF